MDTYNADLRDPEGFVGDRASRCASAALVEDWRERLRKSGQEDPLGEIPARELKKKLDKVLLGRADWESLRSAAPAFFSKLKVMPR